MMSQHDDNDNNAAAALGSLPGPAMRMVMSSLRAKFSDVQSLSTSTLATWLKVESPGSYPQQAASKDNECPPKPDKIVLLDVRADEEFNVSHIAGAVRADFGDDAIQDIITRIPDLTGVSANDDNGGNRLTVVCYCSLGYRSSTMAQKLKQYYKQRQEHQQTDMRDREVDIYNLDGSLFKWANEGRPMIDLTSKPTKYAHPYTMIWGRLLNKELRKDKI